MPQIPLDILRQHEGFRDSAYPDYTIRNGQRVNSGYRVGYGSDTVTMADGSVVRVTPQTRTTQADAERDLARRVETEFAPRAAQAVGPDVWARLTPQQQSVLVSITYNYGSLPGSVANAVRSGGDVAGAIRALGSHNGGINQERREAEASAWGGQMGTSVRPPMRLGASVGGPLKPGMGTGPVAEAISRFLERRGIAPGSGPGALRDFRLSTSPDAKRGIRQEARAERVGERKVRQEKRSQGGKPLLEAARSAARRGDIPADFKTKTQPPAESQPKPPPPPPQPGGRQLPWEGWGTTRANTSNPSPDPAPPTAGQGPPERSIPRSPERWSWGMDNEVQEAQPPRPREQQSDNLTGRLRRSRSVFDTFAA